jgi:hypothetical protein
MPLFRVLKIDIVIIRRCDCHCDAVDDWELWHDGFFCRTQLPVSYAGWVIDEARFFFADAGIASRFVLMPTSSDSRTLRKSALMKHNLTR